MGSFGFMANKKVNNTLMEKINDYIIKSAIVDNQLNIDMSVLNVLKTGSGSSLNDFLMDDTNKMRFKYFVENFMSSLLLNSIPEISQSIANSESGMQEVVNSDKALKNMIGSSTSINNIVSSSIGIQKLTNSLLGMSTLTDNYNEIYDDILLNTTALSTVLDSDIALQAIFNSNTAMDKFLNNKTPAIVDTITNSAKFMSYLSNSTYAMSKVVLNDVYLKHICSNAASASALFQVVNNYYTDIKNTLDNSGLFSVYDTQIYDNNSTSIINTYKVPII